MKKHNRALLLVFTILFGMVSTFGTVSFATEISSRPATAQHSTTGDRPHSGIRTACYRPCNTSYRPHYPHRRPHCANRRSHRAGRRPHPGPPNLPLKRRQPPSTSHPRPSRQRRPLQSRLLHRPRLGASVVAACELREHGYAAAFADAVHFQSYPRPTTSGSFVRRGRVEESSSEAESSSSESSSSISLPSVSVPDDSSLLPSSSMAPTSNRTVNWIGIIAWVCIGLGVVVVVIVILSNRRPPRGGSGRKRYRRPKRRKKHLLNDKYYRNLKY